MAKLAPQPLDLLDFQFKLRCRLKVFNNDDSGQFNKPCSLITAASNFGLVFVGNVTSSLQVIQIKIIEECKGNENEYSSRTIPLPSQPKFLSVNCDHTKLCVVVEKDSCANALIYDVVSFVKEGTVLEHVIRLSPNPNVNVLDISWNPTIPSILTVCKSDGSLGAYSLNESGIEINELPVAACATCMCWSPKGKQIAVGSRDGKITQYKPDLKAVKAINAPPLEGTQKIIALQWISNYQFIGVYYDESNNVSNILVVDAPKTGEPTYTNYEDICYSNGMTRPVQFFIIFQPTWNVLLVASSNSMEVGVMGIVNDQWIQWILIDAARAELPLLAKRKETFPIGLALDTAASQPLQWAETTLPPAPLLYMLSDHGVLCCFDVVNIRNGAASICSPPKPLSDTSGLKYFSKNALQIESTVSTTINPETPVSTTSEVVPNPELTITLVTTESAVVPKQKIDYVIPLQNTFPTTTKPLTFMSLETSSANRKILSAKSPQKVTIAVTPSVQTQPSKTQSPINTTVLIPKEASPSMVGQLVSSSQPVAEKQVKEEHEAALLQQIRKDCILLESELHAVLHKARSLKFDLGADTEIIQMLTDTETLENFLREVSETSTGQSAEIYALKQSVINTWAWYEEARSRFTASQDPQLAVLLKAQPLDPASERQLLDIRHLLYYIESQLTQASRALDEEWDNFQNYCRKTYKIQIPSIEVIYQSMVRQSAIIQKQVYLLKDISNRIKRCSRNTGIPLLVSSENVNSLEKELKNLHIQRQGFSEVLYESVLNKEKQMATKKVEKLRNLLLNRKVSHVSVNKPQLSSVMLQKKEVEDTILGAQVSPVAKDKCNVVRSLNFIQSTPKAQTVVPELVQKEATINNKTQIFNTLSDSSAFASTAVASTSSDLIPKASTTTSFSFAAPLGAVSKPTGLFQAVSSSVSTTTKSFVFATQSNSIKPTSSAGLFSNISIVSNSTKIPNTESKTAFQTISPIGTQPNTKALTFISSPQTSLFSAPIKKPEEITTAALVTPKTIFGTTSTGIVIPSVTSAPLFGTLSKVTSTTSKSDATTKPKNVFVATPITSTKENATSSSTYSLFGTSGLGNTTALFGNIIKTSSAPSNASSDNAVIVSKYYNVTAASVPSISTNTSATLITSVFNPTSTTSTTTSSSIFGSKTATTVTSSSLFGGSVPTTSVQGSIFSAPTTSATGAPIFGVKTTQSIFNIPASSKPEVSSGISPVVTSTIAVVTTSSVDTTTTVSTTPLNFSATISTSASTKSPGIFSMTSNSPAITTTASVFTPPKTTSIFGASSSSTIFSLASPTTTATTTSVISPPIKTTQSIFGTSPTTNVISTPSSAAQNVFTTTIQGSIFGANTAPVFSTSSTSPLFGTTSTTNSIFGSTPSTSTTGSIFGSATSASGGSIFASAAAGQKFIFGGSTTATTTTTTPVLTAQPLNLATAKEAPFASPSFGTTTVAAPIFGGSTANSAFTNNSNTFGTTTTKETSLFGQPAVFGSGFSAPTTTVTPVFGSSTSVFGTATTTSPFGSPSFANISSSNSVFGQPTAFGSSVFAKTTSSSIFGGTPSTTTSAFNSGTSAFGGASSFSPFNTSSTSSSVFGSPTAQPSAFSFAGSTSNTNTFGGFPASTSSFGFGSTTAPKQQSTFGFGSLNVATSSSSGFGQTQTQNPFGRTSGTEQKSVFGGGSIFAAPASTSSSIFGSSGSSTFGATSQQAFGSSAFGSQQSVFGQKPVFGQSSFSSGGSIFGGGAAAQPGPFSGGGQTVSQSGFGAAPAFQKPGGFGGSPVFGSTSPVGGFGSPPSFGGAPTFGSSPTFGTGKVFGSSSPQNTFGSTATQQNTFGSLANQNTVGFGSLAQQTQTPTTQATPFGGTSSFSSWR